jgi:hypothetical protein
MWEKNFLAYIPNDVDIMAATGSGSVWISMSDKLQSLLQNSMPGEFSSGIPPAEAGGLLMSNLLHGANTSSNPTGGSQWIVHPVRCRNLSHGVNSQPRHSANQAEDERSTGFRRWDFEKPLRRVVRLSVKYPPTSVRWNYGCRFEFCKSLFSLSRETTS